MNKKKQKGGCLLIDKYWYESEKKFQKNERAR